MWSYFLCSLHVFFLFSINKTKIFRTAGALVFSNLYFVPYPVSSLFSKREKKNLQPVDLFLTIPFTFYLLPVLEPTFNSLI